MVLALMLTVILLPFIGGTMLLGLRFKSNKSKQCYIMGYILLNTALTYFLLLQGPTGLLEVVNFAGSKLNLSLKLDGPGMVFAGLVAALWPLAVLYSFPYMEHEKNGRVHEGMFYMFYSASYGVTLGIAMSGNLITMYCFYELLTLVTAPLVLHTLTDEAVHASRTYFYYSLGGAAFAFIGMIFLINYGSTLEFVYGGVLDMDAIKGEENLLLGIYVLSFMGFGVKSAIFPLNAWLPKAGVAPTPVSALLHAVAVVKSGAFAIMRLTYFSFGAGFLRGTWAQQLLMCVVIFTILYGSSMAMRETHIKRRLAYSTMSNLSYILFGLLIMDKLGLFAAFCHMVFHGIIKISAFFCAGSMIMQAHAEFIHDIDGMAKRMPKIFALFTISSLALMGAPGFCGFLSKWNLAQAAFASKNMFAVAGVGALLISALFTAIYMFGIVFRAYFPAKDFNYESIGSGITDPDWRMLLPLFVFAAAMVAFGIFGVPFVKFLTGVVGIGEIVR